METEIKNLNVGDYFMRGGALRKIISKQPMIGSSIGDDNRYYRPDTKVTKVEPDRATLAIVEALAAVVRARRQELAAKCITHKQRENDTKRTYAKRRI